jgi:hypothetical protein
VTVAVRTYNRCPMLLGTRMPTTKRQVAAMVAEEKPFLLPLPVEPFRYYLYGERVVHLDGCVEVEAAYCGAPAGWIDEW